MGDNGRRMSLAPLVLWLGKNTIPPTAVEGDDCRRMSWDPFVLCLNTTAVHPPAPILGGNDRRRSWGPAVLWLRTDAVQWLLHMRHALYRSSLAFLFLHWINFSVPFPFLRCFLTPFVMFCFLDLKLLLLLLLSSFLLLRLLGSALATFSRASQLYRLQSPYRLESPNSWRTGPADKSQRRLL